MCHHFIRLEVLKVNCFIIHKQKERHHYIYHHLRARRALMLFKDVPLRTRRVLSVYNVYGNSNLLVVIAEHLWTALMPFWLLLLGDGIFPLTYTHMYTALHAFTCMVSWSCLKLIVVMIQWMNHKAVTTSWIPRACIIVFTAHKIPYTMH